MFFMETDFENSIAKTDNLFFREQAIFLVFLKPTQDSRAYHTTLDSSCLIQTRAKNHTAVDAIHSMKAPKIFFLKRKKTQI